MSIVTKITFIYYNRLTGKMFDMPGGHILVTLRRGIIFTKAMEFDLSSYETLEAISIDHKCNSDSKVSDTKSLETMRYRCHFYKTIDHRFWYQRWDTSSDSCSGGTFLLKSHLHHPHKSHKIHRRS